MDLNGKLLKAAEKGDTREVERLIQEGVDIDAKDNYGWTALLLAAKEGHTKTAELLIEKGADVIYAYKHYSAKTTINQIAEEKPELFTEKEKLMFDLYSNPEKIPQDKKKEVIEALRESQKKGSITKEQSLQLFTNLQKIWNENTDIRSKELRKPRNIRNQNRIKRIVN
ncbi:ankyrin repeat domain-containing protein [Candidatus Micrarchaeota archaeon]|nr:ankyrin repeat domain-containing protein [Candidatus Micrarchaeota archaeon]